MFGVAEIPNFAHGNLYMIGAFLTFFFVNIYRINYFISIPLVIVATCLIGLLCYRISFWPLRKAGIVANFMMALGLLIFLENLALFMWGPDYRKIRSPFVGVSASFFGIVTSMQRLLILMSSMTLVVGIFLFLRKTKIGKALRATIQDREAATTLGINIHQMYLITFALSSALAGAAGSIVGPIFVVCPTMGMSTGLKAYLIAIFGGLGSAKGAIAGSIILGIAEAFTGAYFSPIHSEIVGYLVMVIVLMIRPYGLVRA